LYKLRQRRLSLPVIFQDISLQILGEPARDFSQPEISQAHTTPKNKFGAPVSSAGSRSSCLGKAHPPDPDRSKRSIFGWDYHIAG
jgi:hypothetical protein